ncbi:MAG: hypothetical protein U0636_02910 [Phycisphaerales bacterium]
MAPEQPCDICRIQEDAAQFGWLEAHRCDRWVVRHHPLPAPLVGWTFLGTVRHVQGFADLDAVEADQVGPMLQRVSRAVRALTGCDRVYAIAFGQGAPHLHVHLIPRFDADPATRAWAVADWYRAVERGDQPPAPEADVRSYVRRLSTALRSAQDASHPHSSP